MADTTQQKPAWPLIVALWLVLAAALVTRTVIQWGTIPLLADTDDAMRMVTALDLLNGQAWQDIVQHRDNTPFGVSLHWSRLVDAPIALLVMAARPFFGSAAPDVAAVVWPLLLMLPLMLLSAAIVRRVVPQAGTLTGAVLPVLSLIVLIEFLPGRVDHHNIQIVICLAALLALLLGRDRRLGAVAAGLCAATSLAIGMETLPVVAGAILIYAVLWATEPGRYRAPLLAFAAALALGTLGHFLIATPPATYFVPSCDILSISYVATGAFGAAALAAIALFASGIAKVQYRVGVLVAAGAATLAFVVLLFPQCLRGPYSDVPPDLVVAAFANIGEMVPLFERMADPVTGIPFGLTVLVSLPITAWRAWAERGERRVDWLIILLLLVLTTMVMILQIRGGRLAAPLAVPGSAYLIWLARQLYLARRNLVRAGALVVSWFLASGVFQYGILGLAALQLAPQAVDTALGATEDARPYCLLRSSYARLAGLPPGRVLAPYRLGSHILYYTHHAVVGTGFHRNAHASAEIETFFAGDEDRAHRIVTDRGVDLVVICPGARAYDGTLGPAEGQVWRWLTPLSAPTEDVQIYRVVR